MSHQAFTPAYSKWRHGGWTVTNVRYPSGVCGCVSDNYPDKKWRIVCDRRRIDLNAPGDFTFPTRDAAARAEFDLAQREHERLAPFLAGVDDPQLRYSAVSLFESLERSPGTPLAKLVSDTLLLRSVDAAALHSLGQRYAASRGLSL